ncbi:MAG: GDSL-type esterase/lipase family protein [Sulfurovum sp.]|nr:GDSL-type esterase/lipase family protein [Sulfurovum sp.]
MNIKFIYTLLMGLFLFHTFLQAEIHRIMPLGDSITYDDLRSDYESTPRPTGIRKAYRADLWYMLEEAKISVDFVGSQVAGQDIVPPFDVNNEGHPGWTSYDISSRVYQFLSANPADTILLHIGTNDRSSSVDGITAILDDIDRYERDSGTHVRVLVAMIIGRLSVSNVVIDNFNANLTHLVQQRIQQGDMLTLVDMYQGAGLISDDYADITHPNASGYQKMATLWFNTLIQPYNVALHSYPQSIVSSEYIQSVVVDENTKLVTFVTKVPDYGITF